MEPEDAPKQHYSDKQKGEIFNNEFLPHIHAMYNFGYRLTLDRDDAKDLVQDTYLKAYRFIESFQQGTNAKAWLFRILKNSFINDYRKKSKEPSKVDYQEVETYYNSEEVDRQITPDLRVESLKDMIGDEIFLLIFCCLAIQNNLKHFHTGWLGRSGFCKRITGIAHNDALLYPIDLA